MYSVYRTPNVALACRPAHAEEVSRVVFRRIYEISLVAVCRRRGVTWRGVRTAYGGTRMTTELIIPRGRWDRRAVAPCGSVRRPHGT